MTNLVIQGTNRQNIVYDEAFEVTREFHKLLEQFFQAKNASLEDRQKIYYERRSKQYAGNPRVSVFQKINFKILTQSFVSIFIEKPEIGFLHELKLLQKFKNKIFIDSQSFDPYYVASAIFLRLEYYFRHDESFNEIRTYKAHVALIFRVIIAGIDVPDINNSKMMGIYCSTLIKILFSGDQFKEHLIGVC